MRWQWIVLAIYVLMTATLTACHEPWRDEADSWLLVRDSDFGGVVQRLPYAGTPGLWYLILFPLPRLGLPYFSQSLVNLVFVVSAVALFLWKAPFPPLLKLLAIFSYHLGFEFPVIARSYGLAILFLFAMAAMYKDRCRRPLLYGILIAALANVTLHTLIAAIALTAGFGFELARGATSMFRRAFVPLLIPLIGIALAVVQLVAPADRKLPESTPLAAAVALRDGFFPFFLHPLWIFAGLAVVAAALLLIVRTAGLVAVMAAATLTGLLVLYAVLWYGGVRHGGLLLVFVLFFLWIAEPGRAGLMRSVVIVFLSVSFVFAAYTQLKRGYWELRYSFSGSREVAEYLKQTGLHELPIAAYTATRTEAVLPYFDRKKFWYVGPAEFGSFLKWDKNYNERTPLSERELVRRAAERFKGEKYLLLVSYELESAPALGLELIYRTSEIVFGCDERYFLYAPRSGAAS